MLWPYLVDPWWYSSYTSHLHVKINLGAGSQHSYDTLSTLWQGTVQYSWPGWPQFKSKEWKLNDQWREFPEGNASGIPFLLTFLAQRLDTQWGSISDPSTPIRVPCSKQQLRSSFGFIFFLWLSEHVQGRETLTEMFKKLCLLTGELQSRLKDSLKTFEERENNEKYRFGLTLSHWIGIFAYWRI